MNIKFEIVSKLLLCASLCFMLYILYLQSYIPALQTPTFHLDGAFQTSSALFRLARGENIGQDFFFYLGIGPAYLLYPLFKLMGGTLSASVLASHLSVKTIFLLTVFVLTKLALHFSFVKTLFFTLLFYVIFDFLVPGYYFNGYMEPGFSLRPVRRFVPIIGALLLLLLPRVKSNKRAFYLGGGGAFLATWSNDYGYFSAVFLSMYFLYEYFSDSKSIKLLLTNSFIYAFTSIITYIILISLVTHGYAIEWMVYNFKGVGENQWWYFSSYTDKIFYFDEVYKIFLRRSPFLSVSIIVSTLLIPSLFILSIRKKDLFFLILSYIGLVLYSGAFITEYLGHLEEEYWFGIYIWLFFSILSLIRPYIFDAKWNNKAGDLLFSFLLVMCLFIDLVKWQNKVDLQAEKLNTSVYSMNFDSYLDSDYLEYVSFFEKASLDQSLTIVEEYASLASVLLEKKSIVPFDSIIHVLGKGNQELYMKDLIEKEPTYITTTNAEFSYWQAWNLTQNWWFYNYLLQNYEVGKVFHNQYVWKRREVAAPFKHNADLKCKIRGSGIIIESTQATDESRMIQVAVRYELSNTQKVIVLLNNRMSPMVSGTSIDTTKNENDVSFPAYFNGDNLLIKSQVHPSDKKEYLSLKSCQVLEIPSQDYKYFDPRRFVHFFNLTDGNWTNGISNNHAGFFVYNSTENRTKYKVGRRIKFVSGEMRSIQSTTESLDYLNVFLSGEPMDGNVIGYPNKIEIIDVVRK